MFDNFICIAVYHIYNEGMLEEEITRLEPRLIIQDIIYQRGNWYAFIKKE
jgi:hypothetical protein